MNLPQDFSRNMELLLGREAFLRLAEALDEPARVAFRPNDFVWPELWLLCRGLPTVII